MNDDKLRLEMYVKNKTHYVFFFSLINDKDKLKRKHHFFAVKKTKDEVDQLGQLNSQTVVTRDTQIIVFVQNKNQDKSDSVNLSNYTMDSLPSVGPKGKKARRPMTYQDLLDI